MIDAQDEADQMIETQKRLDMLEKKQRVIEKSRERAQSANKDKVQLQNMKPS